MWTPVDITSIPSPEESHNAKISIAQLESELADATRLLEQTKRRIEELNADLERTRAWIAPIRRIPFELLSEIFVIASRAGRLEPTTIAAVCHQWRGVVLATPRAWSSIAAQTYPPRNLPLEYVSTYLERSKPCLLHLCIPSASRDCECLGKKILGLAACDCRNVELLLHNADRIGCLSVHTSWMETHSGVSFPNLIRLKVVDRAAREAITLDMSRFPKLQSLDLNADVHLKHSFGLSDIQPLLLKHLHLEMDIDDVWLNLVHHCASTLIVLHIDGYGGNSNKILMSCPKLEHLVVMDKSSYAPLAGCKTVTVNAPRLTRYKYFTQKHAIQVVHQHPLDNLIELTVNHPVSLAKHPRIRRLQIRDISIFLDALEQLELSGDLCPYLESIEVDTLHPPFNPVVQNSAQRRLLERNKRVGSMVHLVFHPRRMDWDPVYDYLVNLSKI